jgi:DME family drug/metabolite transporter
MSRPRPDARGSRRGPALVAAAAVLWGSLGIAGRVAFAAGVQPLEAAFYRAAMAFAVLLGLTARTQPWGLRVRAADLPLFAVYGSVSVAAFFFVYLYAIRETSVATAAMLLYTAPAFVVLLSALVFKERLTARRGVAVVTACAGCALVVGAGPQSLRVSLPGALAGLAAGLTYALYSIFGKIALSRYPPAPTLTYALGCGALVLGTAALLTGQVTVAHPPRAWAALVYLAVAATAAPQWLYLAGLRELQAGRASLIATLEPAVAALLGTVVLGERLQALQVVGGVLILSAVWASRPERRPGGGG